MSAEDRGWGPGWPDCQYTRWVTITLSNGQRLVVHGAISILVKGLCERTMQLGYNLVPGWCWGAACRSIRGSTRPSNHSWALAVDLNAPTNPMGSTLKTDMPDWMPELWAKYGFRWGGTYQSRPDAMHYEFMGTPQDAHRLTNQMLADFAGGGTPDPEPGDDDLNEIQNAMLAYVYEAINEGRLTGKNLPNAEGAPEGDLRSDVWRWTREGIIALRAMRDGLIRDEIREAIADLPGGGAGETLTADDVADAMIRKLGELAAALDRAE